jgi:microcystin-dependent protein
MWEYFTQLDARFPVGAGTLPSGTILAIGDTGGEEKHILTVAELAKHNHPVDINFDSDTGVGIAPNEQGYTSMAAGQVDGTLNHGDMLSNTNTNLASQTGADTAHNTMPPYYTLTFLRRTEREYYIV